MTDSEYRRNSRRSSRSAASFRSAPVAKYVFLSVFYDHRHAREMLELFLAEGLQARLVRVADVPAEAIPDGVELETSPAGSMPHPCAACSSPRGKRRRHKYYGLCRWCGRQVGRDAKGECPACGTPIDPFAPDDD